MKESDRGAGGREGSPIVSSLWRDTSVWSGGSGKDKGFLEGEQEEE